ncbi:hypothetical protein [Lacticaseibacillus hulanensis]|uniref:hypothetical protein n=1 Tax=Lacticaseibacillus hulanensis TaxID=2493111 RepID=UPI000FD8A24E|nr:hypothetical protein [Lacticaseibacillus hulanensis]
MKHYSRMELVAPKLSKDDIDIIGQRYMPQIEKFRQQRRFADVDRFEGIMMDEVNDTNQALADDQTQSFLAEKLGKGRAIVVVKVNGNRVGELAAFVLVAAAKTAAGKNTSPSGPAGDEQTELRVSLRNQLSTVSVEAGLKMISKLIREWPGECYFSNQRVDHYTDQPRDAWKRIGGGLERYFVKNWPN